MSVSESLDTATAAGRLVINIMASVSQWEREAIGERTRDALRAKRARGERAGVEPYGFRVNGDGRTLHPHAAEQAIIALIQDCRAARYPLRAIAEELNRAGHSTRTGTPWRFEYVRSLLKTVDRHDAPRAPVA